MKTKKINIYELSELDEKAQKIAHQNWRQEQDYSFLKDDLTYKLNELLKDNKIKIVGDTGVLYSLSYCQGDGAMFYGEFEWKKYTVYIKQSGRYYHSNAKLIEIHETKNLGIDIGEDYEPKVYADFEKIYQKICKELERYGYDVMETNDSFENFSEWSLENDVEFLLDGTKAEL